MPESNTGFTDFEEEFFRAGANPDQLVKRESLADLDDGYEQPSLWQRWFGRRRTWQ